MSKKNDEAAEGEFLWLVSLSDLMILLFVFFVVLFSFSYKRMKQNDFARIHALLNNEEMPVTPIDKVGEDLKNKMEEMNMNESVSISIADDELKMEIKDTILFGSGDAELKSDSEALTRLIGNAIEKIPPPYKIGIEGHTDDVPIHTARIADNWELSSRRAHSLLLSMGLNEEVIQRVVIMGFGQMSPVAPNRHPDGTPIPDNQAKNRRVTIRIF